MAIDPDYRDSKRLWARALLRLLVVIVIIALIIWAVISLYNRNKTEEGTMDPLQTNQGTSSQNDGTVNDTITEGDNNTEGSSQSSGSTNNGANSGASQSGSGENNTGSEHTSPQSSTLPATGG